MEIIYDFLEVFFCFFFTGNITEANALCWWYVNFGVALSHTEGHGVFAAHLVHQFSAQILAECDKDHQGQDSCQQEAGYRWQLLIDFFGEFCSCFVKAFCQCRIFHHACFINGVWIIFVCKKDLIVLNLNVFDFFLFDLSHKGSIVYFSDHAFCEHRCDDYVKDDQYQKYDPIIVKQWLFGWFYFFHLCLLRFLFLLCIIVL